MLLLIGDGVKRYGRRNREDSFRVGISFVRNIS